MTDLNKLRSEFEATPEIKAILEVMTVKFVAGFYVSVGFGIEIYTPYNALLNFAWDLWQEKAKAQAVPEGYVVVPKELDKNAALKMAKARILYPSSTKDPVWSEIATQAYKGAIEAEKCRLIRDYKEMVRLVSESGAEG